MSYHKPREHTESGNQYGNIISEFHCDKLSFKYQMQACNCTLIT